MDVEIPPKGSPFQFFSALKDLKIFHQRFPNSSILWHFEVLLLFFDRNWYNDLGVVIAVIHVIVN